MFLVHKGLIVYVHSISKDPLWSCRAWKLCPKSCLPKIVKYRTLILNHSCRMSDHVFRREHNIIKITANDVSRRVLELYLFSRRNWKAWQGSLCHASSKYCLYPLQKCSLIFSGNWYSSVLYILCIIENRWPSPFDICDQLSIFQVDLRFHLFE